MEKNSTASKHKDISLVLDSSQRIPLLKADAAHGHHHHHHHHHHEPGPEPRLPVRHTHHHPKHGANPAVASQDVPPSNGSVYFIGTATTVIEWHGIRILTDPNFLHAGDHVHLGPGVTAERLTNPAVDLDALPPLDCILLSHYHADHFDQLVEDSLNRSFPIITTPHAKKELTSKPEPFRAVHDLDFFESITLPVISPAGPTAIDKPEGKKPVVKITGMPGSHVPPGPLSVANDLLGAVPPTNGWLIELGFSSAAAVAAPPGAALETGYRIYISGDTLFYDELESIPARLAGEKIDLMLVHLGGTTIPSARVPLVMVTMDAAQGVRLMRLVEPDVTVPVHFDDYDLFLSPLERFRDEVERCGLGGRVVYLERGDEYRFLVRG